MEMNRSLFLSIWAYKERNNNIFPKKKKKFTRKKRTAGIIKITSRK